MIKLCKFINQTHLQKRVKYPFNIAVIQFIYRYAVPCLAETGFSHHLNQHHCPNHGRRPIPRHSQILRHRRNEILLRRCQCQTQHGAVGCCWLTANLLLSLHHHVCTAPFAATSQCTEEWLTCRCQDAGTVHNLQIVNTRPTCSIVLKYHSCLTSA